MFTGANISPLPVFTGATIPPMPYLLGVHTYTDWHSLPRCAYTLPAPVLGAATLSLALRKRICLH